MTPKELGATLHELRTQRHISLRTMADEVGITSKHICDIEHGKKDLRLSTMAALLAYFGKDIAIR